jgi:hypothetical protein
MLGGFPIDVNGRVCVGAPAKVEVFPPPFRRGQIRALQAGWCRAWAGSGTARGLALPKPFIRKLLVDEFVVDDGGGQSVLGLFLGVSAFGAHDATLADDVAVLLARNFLGHFENHLDEGIHR